MLWEKVCFVTAKCGNRHIQHKNWRNQEMSTTSFDKEFFVIANQDISYPSCSNEKLFFVTMLKAFDFKFIIMS